MIDAWTDWAARVDGWLPPSDAARSERHRGLARLERCRGAHAEAAAHHGEALLAARAATAAGQTQRLTDPAEWLADELRVTGLLRETARLASDQARHRDALRTIQQAEHRLGQTERRLALVSGETKVADARGRLAQEREALGRAKGAVLDRMRGIQGGS